MITLLFGELKMQLRSPGAMLMLVVLSVLSGPGVLFGVDLYLDALGPAGKELTGRGSDEKPVLQVAVPEEARGWLVEEDRLEVVPPEDADAELLLDGRSATVKTFAGIRSSQAANRLERVVRRQNREARAEAFASAGLTVDLDRLVATETRDVATEAERKGSWLGSVVPAVVAFVVVLVAAYVALDVFTGERERGTLETLLASSADRRAVIAAKYLVVLGQAVLAGLLSTASLFAAGRVGFEAASDLGGLDVAVLAVVSVLLAVQATGLAVVLATVAPTYKAASFLSGPVMIVLLLPAGLPFAPVELGLATALVPVGNLALLSRDLLAGQLAPLGAVEVAGATALHALLATAIAVRLLGREGALFGGEDPAALRRAGFHGRDAAAIYVVGLAALWFFGQSAQAIDLVWGMVVTQIVLFAGIAVAGTWWAGLPLRDTLSLRPLSARDGLLAVVAGLTAPGVGGLALLAQAPVLPPPGSLVESLSGLGEVEGPWWTPIVVFALLPAVCEELLFRGALLGLTRRSLPVVPRVLVNAALFGAFHVAVHRWLPTGALGLLMATATMRSGSLWAGAIVHFLNNALLVSLTVDEGADPDLGTVALLVGMAAISVGSVAAMGRGAGMIRT